MSTAIERAYLRAAATGTTLTFWAERQPEAIALTASDAELTFAELDAQASRVARVLDANAFELATPIPGQSEGDELERYANKRTVTALDADD